MLTIEYRPSTFDTLAGQDLIKKSLLKMAKNPNSAPKTLLLSGERGLGKTTAARLFARALNCPYQLSSGDACGKCEFCNSDIQNSMFYDEYDSSIIGNVNSIKELRDTFYFGYEKGYKVIVFDEMHLVSRQAMGSLLKVLEEPEERVFFVLCTTDPQKILPTIVSRSLELRFKNIPKECIIDYMRFILLNKDIEITEKIENNLILIANKSDGHMRDALMLLENMLLLGEDFDDMIKSSRQAFLNFIILALSYNAFAKKASTEKIKDNMQQMLNELTAFPILDLKRDYESLVLEIATHIFCKSEDQLFKDVFDPYSNSIPLIKILSDRTIFDMFRNENQFQVAMYMLFNRLKGIAK